VTLRAGSVPLGRATLDSDGTATIEIARKALDAATGTASLTVYRGNDKRGRAVSAPHHRVAAG